MLEPKEIVINDKTFVIHKFPATVAIEIMARIMGGTLPAALVPKAGDFEMVESMMIKAMGYVAIRRPALPDLLLGSKELIDNHCVDYKTYLKVLEAIREYNELFFIAGSASNFYANLILTLPAKISKMFIPLSAVSSILDSQPTSS